MVAAQQDHLRLTRGKRHGSSRGPRHVRHASPTGGRGAFERLGTEHPRVGEQASLAVNASENAEHPVLFGCCKERTGSAGKVRSALPPAVAGEVEDPEFVRQRECGRIVRPSENTQLAADQRGSGSGHGFGQWSQGLHDHAPVGNRQRNDIGHRRTITDSARQDPLVTPSRDGRVSRHCGVRLHPCLRSRRQRPDPVAGGRAARGQEGVVGHAGEEPAQGVERRCGNGGLAHLHGLERKIGPGGGGEQRESDE